MLKNIYLIGFSGSGKSSVGKKLAENFKRRFYDTDELIEKKSKLSISEIFKEKGERWFRKEEYCIVTELLKNGYSKIISLGGGTFQNRELRNKIKRDGITIYLSCSQRELYRRSKNDKSRPLLNSNYSHEQKEKIKSLLLKRIDNYKKADYTISTTNKSINEVVKEIRGKLSSVET